MLNRYFTKTLYKGFILNKAVANAVKLTAVSQNNQLFRISKMGFFDYNNPDKNLFSSDSDDDEKTRRRNRGGNRRQDGRDSFFDREPSENRDVQSGKFEVAEIPLYITKMRNEIKDLRQKKEVTSFFPNFKKFVAMHFQNKDRIFAEFPRSSSIFYEYAAAKVS